MVKKIFYWAGMTLLTGVMLFSIQMYFRNYEMVQGFFEHLGYPTYLVYPLATAKILGLIAIWGNFSKSLKEWAYAGFFFDVVLAFTAHYVTDGGGYLFSLLAFIGLAVSYVLGKQVRP